MDEIFASDSRGNRHRLDGKKAIVTAYCDSDCKTGGKQAAQIMIRLVVGYMLITG